MNCISCVRSFPSQLPTVVSRSWGSRPTATAQDSLCSVAELCPFQDISMCCDCRWCVCWFPSLPAQPPLPFQLHMCSQAPPESLPVTSWHTLWILHCFAAFGALFSVRAIRLAVKDRGGAEERFSIFAPFSCKLTAMAVLRDGLKTLA